MILLLPRPVPARYLGLALMLPLFLPVRQAPLTGNMRLGLLDVGQGLSAVVQTSHHTLVFDSGPHFSQSFDAGQAVLIPFLRQQGVASIDTLMISHSDMDHIGGASSLLARMPVNQIISSVPRILRDKRDSRCLAGQHWRWDGVSFQVLHPDIFDYKQPLHDNNSSCVLQITTQTQRVLLTGDIEAPAESLMLMRYGAKLHSSVLVLPHHGSRTSSTSAFLDKVNPELALVPAGWHNRFHFPARSVMVRLRERRIRILNTASAGTIQIDVGQNLQIHTYREQYRRFWQVW